MDSVKTHVMRRTAPTSRWRFLILTTLPS